MQSLHASELLPPGFSAVDAVSDGDCTVITIRVTTTNNSCPSCGGVSGRIHSPYLRRLADLPITDGASCWFSIYGASTVTRFDQGTIRIYRARNRP